MNTIPPTQPVLIEGDGIAAVCCARLLTDANVACVLAKTTRPKLTAILLGEQTQHLLRELFQAVTPEDDLFAGFASIRRRIVRWGKAEQPLDLPHSGIVVAEQELLHRLWSRVPDLSVTPADHAGWRILSSRDSVPEATEFSCGSRQAFIAKVQLVTAAEPDACWVESVSGGWLFLLALGSGFATLIVVGDTAERALSESTLIAPRLLAPPTDSTTAPAYPRILQPLAAPGWIACGTAAMSFDPLCGEGTGNAVREAFLAAAVIRAAHAGEDSAALTEHYAARLQQGFIRHLQICETFYSTGGDGDFWKREAGGLRSCIQQLASQAVTAPPRYRLLDRSLVVLEEPVSAGSSLKLL